jgi:multisubunit Na+/H+ antiporter MnhB subunit
MRKILGVILMEENKKDDSVNKSVGLWMLGLVGLTVYSLGYIAGVRETKKIINDAYGRGIVDNIQTVIFRQ